MNDANDVMTSVYDTLLHLRYPHITNAESQDLEKTILAGENRVCLLSWLLTERSPTIAVDLAKLGDAALEDQLFEYYSQIGICNNKDILLGKCSLKEQLPVLRSLLVFMKKVHMESFTSTNETEEMFANIIKLCTDDVDQMLPLPFAVKPKASYTEASKYFEQREKELSSNDHEDIKINLTDDSHTDDRLHSGERDELFDKETKKFIEAFQTVPSWPAQNRNLDKDITDSICSDIKSACSDFSTLKKILRARDEIANISVPKALPKTTTSLNSIIEDIVIYNEELANLSMTNDSSN
ncbi:uncharacterized protein LOC105278014 isoform X2 [Ooceraea biroi]|uniref:Uncharacterized protein n=1 Tax=Ooceraea biroi TaxID=2015173 RepID=A0A026WNM7_OOCBI|nr:uncharacterized protein LOC105278014 isoform X2 [Ooceraea biroi]EZA56709.1 hypothetical protein X777_02313 [Ooceraea biroi]